MSNDPIQAAIEAAKSAAAAAPAPVAAPAAATAVAVAPVAGAPAVLSAASMMQGSFNVDAYIKVSEDGMKIGDSALITDPFEVGIDMSEVFFYYGVKFGSNPTTYEKTTNRVTSLTGKPWAEVLAQGARVDGPKFKGEFRSADIPMVLLTAVKDIKSAVVKTGAVGDRLGKSLSTTEWKEFEAFMRTLLKNGLNPDQSSVKVRVGFKARKNAANTWGVLTFEFLGELGAGEVNAAA